jgi:hypothetical protein
MQRRQQFRRSPIAVYVGTGVAVVGFALLLIAWAGAVELTGTGAELPFLMAGAVIGLGLVVVGMALLVVETVRRDADARSIELGRLAASMAVLRGELGIEEAREPAAPGAFRPAPRTKPSPARDDRTVELGARRERRPTR